MPYRHTTCDSPEGEILRLGRREEREAQGGSRHREDVVFHIERGDCSTSSSIRTPSGYGGQRIFVVQREDYVYSVPFVEDAHSVFLKTIIPSRKATKQYLGEESEDED